jgi:hypothetical protein
MYLNLGTNRDSHMEKEIRKDHRRHTPKGNLKDR